MAFGPKTLQKKVYLVLTTSFVSWPVLAYRSCVQSSTTGSLDGLVTCILRSDDISGDLISVVTHSNKWAVSIKLIIGGLASDVPSPLLRCSQLLSSC